jgi:nickel/cobalt transporter (NicO) family protein
VSVLRRRLVAIFGLAAALFAGTGLLAAGPASAHPLGNFTVNRYSGLDLSPGRVSILYVLDMAEIPTFQAMPSIDTNGDGTASAAEKQGWADRTAPQLMAHVGLTADGRAVALALRSDAVVFRAGQGGLPILRLSASFAAAMPKAGSVTYVDHNFDDRIGWKEITVRSEAGVAVIGSRLPAASVSDTLLHYPTNLLASPLDVRQAAFSFHPGTPINEAAPAVGSTVSGAPIASGGSFAALITWRLTPLVLIGSLGLAFAFGALHALGPGHGKTITAAYLVGSGARVGQAAGVGVAVALMHTASVLALGVVATAASSSFPSEQIYPWLEVLTGAVALTLGAGLFVVRVRARRSGASLHGHTHMWDEHGHLHPRDEHDHARPGDHVHERDGRVLVPIAGGAPTQDEIAGPRVSKPRLTALAVSGGVLPSPTALVVLLAAIGTHRVVYGLALILTFSLGLAAALIVAALGALRARTFVARRLGTGTAAVLPVISALVIVGFGLFFVVRGAAQV